ncbi:MAG: hypothetical protein HYW81_03495 [Parcubacteria group bacterium]|nr:hypothetical protein [Parcubacteria group bacterium]
MFIRMLYGAVAFWVLQLFGVVAATYAGLFTWDENRVIARFVMGYELPAVMAGLAAVAIGIVIWLGWDLLRERMTTLALLAVIITCVAFANQASADLLLHVRAKVTHVTAKNITATHDTATYAFPKSLLGVTVVPQDSVVIGVEMNPDPRIRFVWKMTDDWWLGDTGAEHHFKGTIAADHAVYSEAVGMPPIVTIAVDDANTQHRYNLPAIWSQLLGYAPGDTAAVAVRYRALVAKERDGIVLIAPDLERYSARLISIKKRK